MMTTTHTTSTGFLGSRMGDPTIEERIERIFAACATPLGFSMRGVASWDQERLWDWRGRARLDHNDLIRLMEIERQVFG